jgi:hypothetical protein
MDTAKRLGLATVPPVRPTPSAISDWLQNYGPLWVNGQTHIVVIAGIDGMNLKVHDPAPKNVGKVDRRSLDTCYAGSDADSRDAGPGCSDSLSLLPVTILRGWNWSAAVIEPDIQHCHAVRQPANRQQVHASCCNRRGRVWPDPS